MSSSKEMKLVFFMDAIEHVSRFVSRNELRRQYNVCRHKINIIRKIFTHVQDLMSGSDKKFKRFAFKE